MKEDPLPWHARQWQGVAAAHAQDRMPHALLLRGPRGVGKHAFALRVAALLACEATGGEERPCGRCRGCRLRAAGAHPDLISVEPAEDRSTIGVDQVRDLIGRSALTRHYAPYRVVRIEPAEAMTAAAANALLKTLEEPPGPAVFVLVSHQSAALPVTIRSRCQVLGFPVPQPEPARDWLASRGVPGAEAAALLHAAHGAPLAALALREEGVLAGRSAVLEDLAGLACGKSDPLAVAKRWRSPGARVVVYWIASHLGDVIRLRLAGEVAREKTGAGRDAMQVVAETVDLRRLFFLLDQCVEMRRSFERQLNLNEALLLESIAVEWARAPGT